MSKIIYIHVPKCGGSSFGAALRMRFFLSQATINLNQGNPALTGEDYILSDYAARGAQLEDLINRQVKVISGHVRYNPALHDLHINEYAFVTLLRDPVERFVSHYNYLQRRHPNPERPNSLEAFLHTKDAKRLASQYLFYFAGRCLSAYYDHNALVHQAVVNLNRFELIGDLSQPQEFIDGLQHLTGARLPAWRRNSAPEPTIVPSFLLDQIRSLCAADIAIYDAIVKKRAAA